MSRYEDASVLRAARRGDRRARERIVGNRLWMVRLLASRYRNLGLPLEDLVQEGSLGLLDALDHYDPRRGPDFDAYVRFRVRRAIRNALTEQSRLVRLPKQIVERRRAIERAEARFVASHCRRPTDLELAVATGLPAALVAEARNVAATPISLDQPVLPDGSTLETLVVDSTAADPELEVIETEEAIRVDDAVQHLPTRQREIVSRHFGLGRPSEQIPQLAADLHLSQQRTRTIERAALSHLRDELDDVRAPSTRLPASHEPVSPRLPRRSAAARRA